MENAILKTLVYADLFDYPLKAWEIHKWLIGKKATLRQLEKALARLNKKIKIQKGYYFLPRRDALVSKRKKREKYSAQYLQRAMWIGQLFKLIPWIKLVGVSGNVAMDNASKVDDIDLMIVTRKKRLWISRIIMLGLLEIVGKRRKRGDSGKKASGKICINLLLEENQLAQRNKDIYVAHEVLQMRVLWQKDGIYQKYLEDNQWAFQYLPNWITSQKFEVRSSESRFTKKKTSSLVIHHSVHDVLESIAKWVQLKYMSKPKGAERISDSALYFHPRDYRPEILSNFQKRTTHLNKTN